MIKKLLQITFWIESILIALFLAQAAWRWLDPYGWWWPSEVRYAVYRILVFDLLTLTLMVLLYRIHRINDLYRLLAMLVLIPFTWIVGLWIARVPFYFMIPETDARAERFGISASQFPLLKPCDQVDAYGRLASQTVSPWDGSADIPVWMVNELHGIPKSTVSTCIANDINKLASKFHGPGEADEITERRMYALVFEAGRLGVSQDSALLSAMRFTICELDADPFGSLASEYSIFAPGYYSQDLDYSSRKGRAELKNMICQ